MQLSKRLEAIVKLAGTCHCVADVGTDHGYIPIYMTEHHLTEKAIAMDVNKGPLERAREISVHTGWNRRLSQGCLME